MFGNRLPVLACLALCAVAGPSSAHETGGAASTVTPVYDHALPNVPGKSLRAVIVEYAPGGGSPAHRHPPSAFIAATVIEGAIVSRVNDEPERTYRAGEHFTERPGDLHAVSRNASDSAPARLLAVFVLDSAETDLVRPVEKK